MAQPGIDLAAALIEGDCLAGLIAERGDRHRMQLLLCDRFGDATHMQLVVEQIPQRRTVEQRHRNLGTDAEQTVADKAAGLADHPGPVAAQHQMTAKALPECRQAFDGVTKVHRPAGEADGVDRARRGADDHRKRIAGPRRQQFGNRRQHPDLIGRPSPATGKNQPCYRFNWTHRNTPWCLEKRLLNRAWRTTWARPVDGS
ncbi:hypothetical protein D3C72_696880 [compost metagenome]